MDMPTAISLVRRDIGDPAETFLSNTLSDGMTVLYDLPQQKLNPIGLQVQYINGPNVTTVQPTVVPGTVSTANSAGVSNFPAWVISTGYLVGNLVSYLGSYYQCVASNSGLAPAAYPDHWQVQTVYTLDAVNGILLLNQAVPLNATLTVTGQAYGMFTDFELTTIITDAVNQHVQGQTITERFRNAQGFITYRDTPKTLANLPGMEENLVVTLADIEAMWILATDAATDVNVQTAEGTNIDRSARYQQLLTHIEQLQQKYATWCGNLGVGMYRTETLNQRRVSRTTGRLIPIFRDREYDDHRYPVRELPQIDRRDEDPSGVPSPIWNGLPI